jgi:ElaB/YqjD/DUF883 family membrane-anchored ribosome-binding protein
MCPATAEAPIQEIGSTVRDRVGDVARQAANISRQAQRVFTSDRVKRQPFAAVGLAVGVGLVLGVAIGWIGARFGRAQATFKG